MNKRSKVRGFTLVELLVVVAVIGLLAGLLVPAMAQAQRVARGAGCLANLREWGSATHGFAADNGDLLPYDGAGNGTSTVSAWYADLPPHLGLLPYHQQGEWRTNTVMKLPRSLWLCPANPRRSDGRMLFHYTLNRQVNGSGTVAHAIRVGAVVGPSRTVWLFDNGKKAAVASAGNVHPNLHQKGANFLFVDGHATRLPQAAYWDVARNRARGDTAELRWTGRD